MEGTRIGREEGEGEGGEGFGSRLMFDRFSSLYICLLLFERCIKTTTKKETIITITHE